MVLEGQIDFRWMRPSLGKRMCVRSMHRVVAKVILVNSNHEIAMAKVKRGFYRTLDASRWLC